MLMVSAIILKGDVLVGATLVVAHELPTKIVTRGNHKGNHKGCPYKNIAIRGCRP